MDYRIKTYSPFYFEHLYNNIFRGGNNENLQMPNLWENICE